jgi:hypothetical protein
MGDELQNEANFARCSGYPATAEDCFTPRLWPIADALRLSFRRSMTPGVRADHSIS